MTYGSYLLHFHDFLDYSGLCLGFELAEKGSFVLRRKSPSIK